MTTDRRPQDPEQVRDMVRERYTRVVKELDAGDAARAEDVGRRIGYSEELLGPTKPRSWGIAHE